MSTLCLWCGSDVYIDDHDEANDQAHCTGPGHPEPRMFEPKAEAKAKAEAAAAAKKAWRRDLGYGIAHRLDLYNDLYQLLNNGEWAETGVIEYRYGTAHPKNYQWMIGRWGHTSQGPRKYSVTSFVGSTLGQLSHSDMNVTYRSGPGTGCFDHNAAVGYWTLDPAPADATTTSWSSFATEQGLDPTKWSLIG